MDLSSIQALRIVPGQDDSYWDLGNIKARRIVTGQMTVVGT